MLGRWGMLLLGLGAGAGAVASFGITTAVVQVVGPMLAVAGAVMLGRSGRAEPDLVQVPGRPSGESDRPALSGLGNRVTDILRMAEEQAADHRAEARRDAERIVADARAEADRIRNAGS